MNYTSNTEGDDWSIQEQIDAIDAQLKPLYRKVAGNTGVAMFIPILGIGLNISVSSKIAKLVKQKKALKEALKLQLDNQKGDEAKKLGNLNGETFTK